jgi:transposase-like protein
MKKPKATRGRARYPFSPLREAVYEKAGGNISVIAREIGTTRQTLHTWLNDGRMSARPEHIKCARRLAKMSETPLIQLLTGDHNDR